MLRALTSEIFTQHSFAVRLVVVGIIIFFVNLLHVIRTGNPRRFLINRARWWRWHFRRVEQPIRQRFLTILNLAYVIVVLLVLVANFSASTTNQMDPALERNVQIIADKVSAIESLLTPGNNLSSTAKNVQTIADELSTIQTLLKPPERPPSSPQIASTEAGSVALTNGMKFLIALIVLTVTSGLAFAVLSLKEDTREAKIAGTLFALSGVTLLAFTVKIDKLVNFEFSLPHQRESTGIPAEQSITIYLPEIQMTRTVLDCGKKDVGDNSYRIWPFPDGLATIKEVKGTPSTDVRKNFEELEGKIDRVVHDLAQDQEANQDERDKNSLIAVLLIGSADKRALGATKESYSNNVGLAQARAEWVQQKLEGNAVLQTKPIITLNSGPSLSLIAVANDSAKLAVDRAVQVCAIWEKKL
jgi:hypothetical protein